jgi:bis(5'-nucleosidyl)-tetraphosphatase
MIKEKSAGAVVFRRESGKTYYLLLHYDQGHWDFPKGHIEGVERDDETALREIEEETSLKDIKLIEGFRQEIKYYFRGNLNNSKEKGLISKIVVFFLGETKVKEVRISHEHRGFDWVIFEEAMQRVTFKNTKNILTRAHNFLKKKPLF